MQGHQHYKVGALSDIGRKRSQNQDRILADPESGLFIVSDGMGGHQGGETASSMAVSVISSTVKQEKADARKNPNEPSNEGLILTKSIRAANSSIHETALGDPKLRGMGTTTTALLFGPGQLTIGHVGDSRCYFLCPGMIWQLTRDHSLVHEKIRAGLITREAAKKDQMKNVITRSVGFEPEVQIDIYQMEVHPGYGFLICSDGLSGLVPESEILETVQKWLYNEGNIEKAVQELIEAANNHGGDDNVSTILVQVL